jgi:hypothetical protein
MGRDMSQIAKCLGTPALKGEEAEMKQGGCG